jgi:hypothetical protein
MLVPNIIRNKYDLIIALDSEYVQSTLVSEPPLGLTETKIPDYPNDLENTILSYQILAVWTQDCTSAEKIIYPEKKMPLGHLIRESFSLVGQNLSRRNPNVPRVCIVWHWGSAEMGSLSDGLHLMRTHEKEIICLGGAVISIKKPFEYSVDLGSRNYAPVLLTFRDTSRLAEEKASLEALGESLGEPKVDISPWSKARMDLLLKGDKELFERYAITDCRIALKWFFNVAETNESVLQIDSMPPTTGSASAEGLIAYLGEEEFAEKFCGLFAIIEAKL